MIERRPSGKTPFPGGTVPLHQTAGNGDQEPHGKIGSGIGGNTGSIGHRNPSGGGFFHINIIEACAVIGDNPQSAAGGNDLPVDPVRENGKQGIAIPDSRYDLFLGQRHLGVCHTDLIVPGQKLISNGRNPSRYKNLL
ncbi:hypothetical protein D3C75_943290 [compost metagenome]